MGNHVSLLESQFITLASMESVIEEQINIAILITSLSYSYIYSAAVALVSPLSDWDATWGNFNMIYIEEQMRLLSNGGSSGDSAPHDHSKRAQTRRKI